MEIGHKRGRMEARINAPPNPLRDLTAPIVSIGEARLENRIVAPHTIVFSRDFLFGNRNELGLLSQLLLASLEGRIVVLGGFVLLGSASGELGSRLLRSRELGFIEASFLRGIWIDVGPGAELCGIRSQLDIPREPVIPGT